MSTGSAEKHDDWKATVKSAVLKEETFLRLTLSKRLREDGTPWVRITVRPVLVKGRRQMQFSYFDPTKDISKNYPIRELDTRLDEALGIPFSHIHVQSTSGDIHVRITRKGKALVRRARASHPAREPILAHDHEKSYLLPAGKADDLLRTLGVVNAQGKVRPGMQGKFRQINEFLRIIQQTVPEIAAADRPIRIVDCGCGSAYLTFAAYHYLHHEHGLPVQAIGVDVNAELVDKNCKLRDSLGWSETEFRTTSIREFVPTEPPDVVLSLHACDTATDEAIAQGILWGSRVILAAPCCQHELHHELRVPSFRPILRHGVLRERLADLLTDAFRALVLRIMGYRTQVIEFVSPEHTSKNVMIRARKGLKPGHAASVREYQNLKAFWGVSPCIEQMLGEEIRRFLRAS